MELYSLLLVLFAIGGLATFKVCRNTRDLSEMKKHWTKFAAYFGLVFLQLLLISKSWYLGFALLVSAVGFYEIWKVGKSIRSRAIGLLLFGIFAVGYLWFFDSEAVEMQQFLFISVIVFDGFSQLFGQLFGRTKLFPKISPGKTLEGMAGGFLALSVSALLVGNFLKMELSEALLYGILIGIFSIAGDFLASYYKRQNGVKDFSRLIPGHGGVLDRFDSLIFAAFAGLSLQTLSQFDFGIWNCVGYVLLFLTIFTLAEIGYRSFAIKAEITRKFVHISSGLACLTFPFFLENWLSVLVLCLGFMGLLVASKSFGLLPSVNAIDRKSQGSLVFPIAIFVCFCLFIQRDSYAIFYLPIVILAICDPLAALCGRKWPLGKYKVGAQSKTLLGSLVFFLSCFAILVLSLYFSNIGFTFGLLFHCLMLSAVATIIEAISRNGYDNLTIPCAIIVFVQLSDFPL
ncbi:phosphatidate cytidylyltransferase [Flavobacterium sp.]|uniref:phosphatidate cytidylyltransferase n=1 Tax=Flavobacterium sp. TaxID=239 RepID=UPI00121C7779|nr:phosphatidate cytidylyltransferase [Flavobacterium sp.]RZJ73457.1 MAG: hypothetical protein EOO49_01190 [Flavobacterium sp.]